MQKVDSAKYPLIRSLGKNRKSVKKRMEINEVAPKLIKKYKKPTGIRVSELFIERSGLFKTAMVVSCTLISDEPLYKGKSLLPVA
jgi:hypothetical protein